MRFKLRILVYFLRFRLFTPRTREAVMHVQQRRLKKLTRVLIRSPFYRELAATGAPLTTYPLMNKAAMMESFSRINTVGITTEDAFAIAIRAETSRDFAPDWNGISIGLSSGTSGNRGIFLASEKERALWVAAVLHRVIGFSLRKRRVAFFLRANNNLYESVNSSLLQFRFYDILFPVNDHLVKLQEQQPHILVAQPSVLLLLAKAVDEKQLHIAPAKIISVAEVLEPVDRRYLERVFKQTIHQVYQATEGFLATTCKNGTLHFNEDTLLIEKKYVDDAQTRFYPVITDLFRESQPVVRYELNDLIIEKQNCSCGSPFLAIEAIEGRSDDVFRFTDRNGKEAIIFPDFIRRAVMLASEHISAYEVVQSGLTEISIFLKISDGELSTVSGQTINNIVSLLQHYQVENVRVIFRDVFPEEEHGKKRRRVRNASQKPV